MTSATAPAAALPPIISIVGRPDCGKTTLLEKLIPALKNQGYKIGAIKHHVHTFEMDKPGKDTWKLKKAGADRIALSSPDGLGVISDTTSDTPIEVLVHSYFADMDLVFTEGYKQEPLPKIEVFRNKLHPKPLERDSSWLAMVSDIPVHDDLPHFLPDDINGLIALIKKQFLETSSRSAKTLLVADGQIIPLNTFAEHFLRRAVLGMTSALKGCENPREMTLIIRDE